MSSDLTAFAEDIGEKDHGLPPFLQTDPAGLVSHPDESNATQLVAGASWLPLIKKLSINLLIPFLNGVMLGFGEIFAHELGVLLGWRTAKGYDPSSMPPATNPRARRRWLFGLY